MKWGKGTRECEWGMLACGREKERGDQINHQATDNWTRCTQETAATPWKVTPWFAINSKRRNGDLAPFGLIPGMWYLTRWSSQWICLAGEIIIIFKPAWWCPSVGKSSVLLLVKMASTRLGWVSLKTPIFFIFILLFITRKMQRCSCFVQLFLSHWMQIKL